MVQQTKFAGKPIGGEALGNSVNLHIKWYRMSDINSPDDSFILGLKEIVEQHLSDEKFGVSELAREAGMSRSNLLRKVRKSVNLSVSQFIRQVRLQHAMELLKEEDYNVSEVSYQVGFSSTSYFIKCFREHYGYPPGEVGKKKVSWVDSNKAGQTIWDDMNEIVLIAGGVTVMLVVVLLAITTPWSNATVAPKPDKSVAVLPFVNNSSDSANLYLINGLMEAVLNDLQQIEDLRVISRTSVEKYRMDPKTIPEIASELEVSYIVEGSGQKIGDQIQLNIQLIEAQSDEPLWAAQYNRETRDIFRLQNEVAGNIAEGIEAVITQEEQERITKPPTDNMVAYDYFLQGLEPFHAGTRQGLEEAIPYFEQAISHDPEFARAYADIAISYYYLDFIQPNKSYTEQINSYSDKAMLYDPYLSQSLAAKALYYLHTGNYESALPYLETALEYHPNSVFIINQLADFYTTYLPNAEKYLEYALKGARLDINAHDSSDISFTWLHISNALVQTGFVKEAEQFVNKSLAYNPDNLYSQYVKAYILYARDGDLAKTRERLTMVLQQAPDRLDIVQETAKISYFMRDYERAYTHYQKFIELRQAMDVNMYRSEDAKIGVVLSELGREEEAAEYFAAFKEYADHDASIYKHLSLAAYYSYMGEPEQALEHLRLFSEEDQFHYWTIAFLNVDPLMDNIRELPEFAVIQKHMEAKFTSRHEALKRVLEREELI